MSKDRNDPRVRELTFRLMEMAPDAPPFPQEASAMNVSITKNRPPMLVWAVAAAAVVLLVGVPLVLFRGGDATPPVASTIVAPTSTAPPSTTPPSTTPPSTTVPGTAVPGGQQEIQFSVYLFSENLATTVGDPALVPVWRTAFIGPDAPTEEATAAAVIAELLQPAPAGYTTSIPFREEISTSSGPKGLDGRVSVAVGNGVATIDFPAEFAAGGGTMSMTTRLAQVVFTATQFPSVDSVLFKIDGEVVEVFSAEGLILDGPQTRRDYVDILPFIFLDTPAIGSIAPSPVRLSGMANVFEATVSYEIVDDRGNVLAEGFTTATCGTGCWGDFSVEVPYDVTEETLGEVVVYEESARDGSRVNELRYPVTLVPGDGGTVPTTTVPPTVTTTTLPGEAFDFGPQAGDVVGVVGVAHDDVLNVRRGPGTGFDIVTMLDPLADDVIATGRHRLVDRSIWDEVTANGVTGWVNSRFVGYLGSVDDLTSFIVDQLGEIPRAETMLDLGQIVAGVFESSEGGFRMAVSVAPTVGELGEVTYDVVGLADDAQLGYRLHVFGQPTEGGEGFSLMSVEATSFCSRGVTAEGLCV